MVSRVEPVEGISRPEPHRRVEINFPPRGEYVEPPVVSHTEPSLARGLTSQVKPVITPGDADDGIDPIAS